MEGRESEGEEERMKEGVKWGEMWKKWKVWERGKEDERKRRCGREGK